MRCLPICLVLFSVVLLGCDGDDGVPFDPGTAALTPIEQDLLAAINQERVGRGLTPVTLRDDLVCAAQHHSRDIGGRQACTHDGANGSGPGDRVEACAGAGWSGEIVACGHTTPRAAVDGWLNSPGHRAIMLDPDQRLVGLSMSANYWTAIFDH